AGTALGVIPVDVHVPPFYAQLPAGDVLLHRRQGLIDPLGTVRTLDIGEEDDHYGRVDGAHGHEVVGIAGLLTAEVGSRHLLGMLDGRRFALRAGRAPRPCGVGPVVVTGHPE